MTAKHVEISAEEYHAHPAIGSSMLEDLRESRRLYEGRYVLGTIPRKQPTPEMHLGTWFHIRLLEPDRFFSSLAEPMPDVAPDGKKWLRRKDSDHERWWQEELEKRDGKLALDKPTLEKLEAMVAAVERTRWGPKILNGDGQAEFSIFWTDAETGLELKCRVDLFRPVVSIDTKSTGSVAPADFVKRCVSLGYHRRRAHYLAGLRAFTADKDAILLHIAVSTEPPFSAGAYELGDYDRYTNTSLGLMEWRYALRSLAKCVETGDYSDAWEHEVMRLDYPAYAFTQRQYQL